MARKSQPVKKPTAKQTAAQKRQTQNRREIWALVCIFLAIFSIICCFNITYAIRQECNFLTVWTGKSGGADKDLVLAKAVKMQDNREAGGLRLSAGPKGR